MNISYILYFIAFITSLAFALSFLIVLGSPISAKNDVSQLVCDICYVYRNPGSKIEKIYFLKGNSIEFCDGIIVLRKPFWIFPPCGRQVGNKVYLPIKVDLDFKVSGVACIKMEYKESEVHVSLCRLNG